MLEYSKNKYKQEGKFASKKDLREIVKHQGLFSQVAQELVDRLINALNILKRGTVGHTEINACRVVPKGITLKQEDHTF